MKYLSRSPQNISDDFWYYEEKNGLLCLHHGDEVPPCLQGEKHFWAKRKEPLDCKSGLHEEKCKNCGIIRTYDTSD